MEQPSSTRENPLTIPSGSMEDVIRIAIPLILASSSHALKLFTDRVMLSYDSPYALAASLSAGLIHFTLMTFFLGSVTYTETFVAQYIGARETSRVGIAVWQGIYLALLGGLILACGSFVAPPLFYALGDDPALRTYRIGYYRILSTQAVFQLLTATIGSFYSGRGRTWTLFAIEFLTVVVNLVGNWLLIYGNAGFPHLGIYGAGIATMFSTMLGTVVIFLLFLHPTNRIGYATWPRKTFDRSLFRRLLHFGIPNGIHLFLDLASFTLFVMLIQDAGAEVGVAATMALSFNAIAFIPMAGIGMTVTILVGQAVGARKISLAERAVTNASILVLGYTTLMVALFLLFPEMLLSIFSFHTLPTSREVQDLAILFLRYIAMYLFFDGLFLIYSGALKGAGDTRYVMWMTVAMSWVFFALPCLFLYRWTGPSLTTVHWLWRFLVGNVVLMGIVFYQRYRGGKWRSMRVIEGEGDSRGRT